jgi:outer membrane protein OmpA-like peptidoglycan-associated protein
MTEFPLVSGNDFRVDRVRQALLLAEQVLRGSDAEPERLSFRMILTDFAVDDDVLTDEHKEQLDELIALGRRFRALRVLDIVGRASQTGAEANNRALSQRRAVAASGYLVLGGVGAERLPEPRALGSDDPIVDVGPAEEPFNRSVEIIFTFEHVPRLATTDPTASWSIVPGQDTGWLFAGSQRLTLIRNDTGERRSGTFNYADLTLSVGPSGLLRKLLGNRVDDADELFDEGLKALPHRWQRWLSQIILETTTSLSVMPADDPAQPRPLVVEHEIGWEMFEQVPTFLLEPMSVAAPVGEAGFAVLIFGWPYAFAGCKGPDASAGLGSVFPELSTGLKVGAFELD